MALVEWREDDNERTRSALFWVMHDYVLQRLLPKGQSAEALTLIRSMKNLLERMEDKKGYAVNALLALCKHLMPYAAEIQQLAQLAKTDANKAYEAATAKFGPTAEGLDELLHETFGWIQYHYLKANLRSLSSLEIRTLLRDYLLLKNERPSMLHSYMLHLATAFAKNHADFNFYKFLTMWDAHNFRNDDFSFPKSAAYNSVPLVNEVCRLLVDIEDFCPSDFIAKCTEDHRETIANCLREAFHAKILDCHKTDGQAATIPLLQIYRDRYVNLGTSGWNSEVLRLAYRTMYKADPLQFMHYAKACDADNKGFCNADFRGSKDENGNDVEPFAQTVANGCFDLIEKAPSLQNDEPTTRWLKSLYLRIVNHEYNDEAARRKLAAVCMWRGERAEAISLCKKMIAHNPEANYLWRDMAEMIDDERLQRGFALKAECLNPNEADSENDVKLIREAEDFVFANYQQSDFVLVDKRHSNGVEHCLFIAEDASTFEVETKRFSALEKSTLGTVFRVRFRQDAEPNDNAIGESKYKINPLTIRETEADAWLFLPIKYGIVESFDERNGVSKILTQNSRQMAVKSPKIERGTFVRFREFEMEIDGERQIRIADVQICERQEALEKMPKKMVMVDSVNEEKRRFHVRTENSEISDIIGFDQVDDVPEVGDFLEVTYLHKRLADGSLRVKFLDVQPNVVLLNGMRKTLSGTVSLHSRGENGTGIYGILDGNFVRGSVLKRCGIGEECRVEAKMVLTAEGKWKVVDLKRV